MPEDPARLDGWLARNVLRPSMPLFDEARATATFAAAGQRLLAAFGDEADALDRSIALVLDRLAEAGLG